MKPILASTASVIHRPHDCEGTPPQRGSIAEGPSYLWLRPCSAFMASLCPKVIEQPYAATAANDAAAMANVRFERLAAALLRKCGHRCCFMDSGDLAAEAMVRIETTGLGDRFDPSLRSSAGALVYRVMTLLFLEHTRTCDRWQNDRTRSREASQVAEHPCEQAIRNEHLAHLAHAWREIASPQRQALCLRYGSLFAMSVQRHRCSTDAVQRSRGRCHLRRLLETAGVEVDADK